MLVFTVVDHCCCCCCFLFHFLLAPIAPVVLTLMEKEVSQSSVQIHLWPVEQRNGPIR